MAVLMEALDAATLDNTREIHSSNLTIMVPAAGFDCLCISLDLRLHNMNALIRGELSRSEHRVMQCRFAGHLPSGLTNNGFNAINTIADLRTSGREQKQCSAYKVGQ